MVTDRSCFNPSKQGTSGSQKSLALEAQPLSSGTSQQGFSGFSHQPHGTAAILIYICSSNCILLASSLQFIANFGELLICIILLKFYEKSIEFHHLTELFLTPLSV
jgi:hypothetical protein